MKKKTSTAFGKRCYLLGADKDGIWYWLEAGTWNCDWYWGFGYVETYINNKFPNMSYGINTHQYFDGLFFKGPSHGFDNFKSFFVETPLSDKEIWTLCELMKSFYTAGEYSDMIYRGSAHYTTNPVAQQIKNEDEYKRINECVIPAIMFEVYKILGWESEESKV